ncbi:MAG: MFS transporter [Burkholderiales bacterium]|jgi:AAA family ATP:ADP antiporter
MSQRVVHGILKRLVRVEPDEVTALLLSFGYFFCLLCSYYILRPVRDEMGIQAGVEQLQWLFTGTFATMLAIVPLFGWLSSKFPRRQFLPVAYLFFAANLMVFYALFRSGTIPAEVAKAFFIWLSVFSLFVVSVFWSFMADLFTNAQARRLFGFVAAGGTTGAIAGPLITAWLAPLMGPTELLPFSACFLLAAIICILRLSDWARQNKPETTPAGAAIRQPMGGSFVGGITLMLRSDYLLGIGLYVVLFTLLSTFLYFQQIHIVSETVSDPGIRTALFALIDLFVNALTLLGQLLLVSRIIGRFGLTVTLVLMPIVTVIGFLTLGLFPTLAVLIVFGCARRIGEYALSKPAREVLFTVLSREEKYKAKNFIDTVVLRGGDAVSGWLFEGLRLLGIGLSGISFIAAPIALLWAMTAYLLGQRQEQLRAALTAKRIYPLDDTGPQTPISPETGGSTEPAAGPVNSPR